MDGFKFICQKWVINKDPNAVLDYYWDWRKWLQHTSPAQTIASYTIDLEGSSTAALDSDDEVDGVVKAVISGGAEGDTIKATCHIVTADGLEEDRTLYIKVVQR